MNATAPAASAMQGKTTKIISWILRILSAAIFLFAAGAKLTGLPMMVALFEQIGIGQWFRIFTGIVQVVGGIAILLPATAAFGGLLLAATMAVAVLIHLFVIGGSAVPALVLLLITTTVAWLHRASVAATLGRLRQA